MYARLDLLQIKVIFLYKNIRFFVYFSMNKQLRTIFPKKIRCAAITAPAGFPDPTALEQAIKELQKAVAVKDFVAKPTACTPSYLAADAAERLACFNAAVNDPEVDLILAVRGGFGSVHILPGIDYDTLRRRQLPVMGYSDITSLHCAMLTKKAGIPISGSNLLQLNEVIKDDLSFASHKLALCGSSSQSELPAPALQAVNAQGITAKTVASSAYAANLTVLTSLCGTEFMPDFSNKILIIEDVNEPVYKIDRMLEQLRLAGLLKNIAALVFGEFTDPENSTEALTKLFERFAALLDCPCYKNFAFGHKFPMCAVNSSYTLHIADDQKPFFTLD